MARCRTRELRRRTESGRLAPAILAKNIWNIYKITRMRSQCALKHYFLIECRSFNRLPSLSFPLSFPLLPSLSPLPLPRFLPVSSCVLLHPNFSPRSSRYVDVQSFSFNRDYIKNCRQVRKSFSAIVFLKTRLPLVINYPLPRYYLFWS